MTSAKSHALPTHSGSNIPDPEIPPHVEVLRDIAYGSHERHAYDVYLPRDVPRPLPVVVYFHSGAWRRRDKRALRTMFVLDHGYAMVSIGYRLVQHAPFPAQAQDVNAGLKHLMTHGADYGLDMSRVLLAGTSAGAHLAALAGLACTASELNPVAGLRPRGVLAIYGAYDLPEFVDTAHLHQVDHTGPDTPLHTATGGDPHGRRDLLTLMSPQAHITGAAPPFYVLHGTDDTVLPWTQSANFAAALAVAGVRVCFEPVPGADHGHESFRQPPITDRIMAFIDDVMRPVPTGAGSGLG